MKKFFQLVPMKELVFGIIMFAVVIGISLYSSLNAVQASFTDETAEITATNYTMTIPYNMVASAELTEMPDIGEQVDAGARNGAYTGIWNNSTWGEYYACIDKEVTVCIVTHLTDGRIFVFGVKDDATTTELFATYQSYLPTPTA